jgi:hypothetical protein
MGDATSGLVRFSFNPQLRVEFRGATVTSDAGLLLPRELDERLGLGALIERHLTDPRTGRNSQFPLPDLFRQSVYSRLAGYEDTNDAERLAEDPAFRMLASRERRETSVALTSTLHWFETEVLAEERNYQGLARLNTDLVQHEAARPLARRLILDIDSSGSPVHGAQEQAAYNGYFESVCYHPLFVFNQNGDCLAATLRPGNVHSADGWEQILLPIIIDPCITNRHHGHKKAGNSEAVIKDRRSAGRFRAFFVIRHSAAMSSSRLSGRPLASVALKWVQTNSSGFRSGA